MAFCTCFCEQLCKPSSHIVRSLIPSRRSHKIQLYSSCTQQSDRLKSLSTCRVAMFKKIAPTCLPASVCTTNQSSPRHGLVGHTVTAGSTEGAHRGEVVKLSPFRAVPRVISSLHKEPGAVALAPLSSQLLSHGALGPCTRQRRWQQTDFVALECFIKQSQSKQTQPHQRYTSSSSTHRSFSRLWENKEAEV